MLLRFNMLLEQAGLAAGEVRLLRHQDRVRGKSIHRLWAEDRPAFEEYQSGQSSRQRARFAGRYWASFVAAPEGQTLFVGLYRVENCEPLEQDFVMPLLGAHAKAGETDLYTLTHIDALSAYEGLLYVAWGDGGERVWVQRADNQDKPIIELRRTASEPAFPGFAAFMTQMSELESMPASWRTTLSACRGVYLLTCPRTHEQYVGAAHGSDGFMGRWLNYFHTGHGGNVALKSREPSDYRVSILEVAGSLTSKDDILTMEALWKKKLQSGEMGLNRN